MKDEMNLHLAEVLHEVSDLPEIRRNQEFIMFQLRNIS